MTDMTARELSLGFRVLVQHWGTSYKNKNPFIITEIALK